MKVRNLLGLSALASALLATPVALAGIVVNAPVDVIGNQPPQFAPLFQLNKYKDWGNEPYVAVNPLNKNDVFISTFTGGGPFYSTTGGASWTFQAPLPLPALGVKIPFDWTFAYDNNGTLHGAILGGPSLQPGPNLQGLNVYAGSTADPTSKLAWSWSGGGAPINDAASTGFGDQPWIALGTGKVFVAYGDFHEQGLGRVGEHVAVSNDNGATFTIDNQINNGAQASSVDPATRIAVDRNGSVYAIFGVGSQTATEGVHNLTYFLNRSRDGGVTWDFNGSSAIGGIVIDSGVSTQADDFGTQQSNNWFAHVNNTNVTAIACDRTGSHVYAVFGKQDESGTDRIYLVEFHPVGNNLVAGHELAVSVPGERSQLPAITVEDNGTVVLMYDTYNADTGKVYVHVASSVDFGASIASDIVEYSFTPISLFLATASSTTDREFGDYDFLTSIGNNFYGTFAGLGDVIRGRTTTTTLIAPFFFSGSADVAEPGSLALLLTGLGGVSWARRRKGTLATK